MYIIVCILVFLYFSAYGSLTVRSLLDTREHFMAEVDFVDIYAQVKWLLLYETEKRLVCFLNPYPNKFLLKRIPTLKFFLPSNSQSMQKIHILEQKK